MNLLKHKTVVKYMAILFVICSCITLCFTYAFWVTNDHTNQQITHIALVSLGSFGGLMVCLSADFRKGCVGFLFGTLIYYLLEAPIGFIVTGILKYRGEAEEATFEVITEVMIELLFDILESFLDNAIF